MDVTPTIPRGRQVVEAYGDGGFRISGARYEGSVIVFPERTLDWTPDSAERITSESLAPVVRAAEEVEVLLVGCGEKIKPLPEALRVDLRTHGLALELMDTGAACRTYNVLLAEERRVAAALIAVD